MRVLSLFLCLVLLTGARPLLAADDSGRPSPATVREWQSRKYGMFIHFGLYSMLGGIWNGKQYSGNYSEQIQSDAEVPEEKNDNPISPAHEQFNVNQLRELMTQYGPLSEVWFDMGHPTKLQSQ